MSNEPNEYADDFNESPDTEYTAPSQQENPPEEYSPEEIPPEQQPVYNNAPPAYPPPPQYRRSSGNHKKKKKKKRRSRVPGILILTTFIFGVSIILSLVIIGYGKDMFGIGKSDKTHLIIIPENASTEEVASMLETDGIIKSPKFFSLFTRLRNNDKPYISGEHFIRPNMAYETIINELTTIEEEEINESVEVTFPEGITLIDAARELEENGVCSADDFLFYFNSGGFGYDFESRLPTDQSIKFMRMEGYLFPDTYYFYLDMDPEQVCQKIYMNFNDKMTEGRLEKLDNLGISLDEMITLASIVQKEAATTGTMTLVASVFWNRLRNADVFPLLQSDPTSNYANDVVRPNMEVVDETIVNSYDTYKSPGLPPGAICNPGIEAIDAVLDDYQSNYFYFIANINTGVTLFAETLEEHYANEAQINQEYEDERNAEGGE